MMNPRFHRHAARRYAISWTLIGALLLLTLLPFQYHLHHDGNVPQGSSMHDHVVDVHAAVAPDVVDSHDDRHTLDSAPDITLKGSGVQLPLVAILPALFVLFTPRAWIFRRAHRAPGQRLPRQHRHLSPPLRAPPL